MNGVIEDSTDRITSYSWTKISGKKIGDTTASKPPLTPGNALHNADSMALLGAGKFFLVRWF
jgi:hypothetical protein